MSESSRESSTRAETVLPPSQATDIRKLKRSPGDPIKSEEWNEIIDELIAIREYVNNMSESLILTGLVSRSGNTFPLNVANPPGFSFGIRSVGLITTQWLKPMPDNMGEICAFGVSSFFDVAYFWASADNGDKEMLDVVLDYVDGTQIKIGENLYVNSRVSLSMPAGNNHYLEYLKAPLGHWYKYRLKNKVPDKEVRTIRFMNVNKECVPRIGNVLHLRGKIRSLT